jgi:hypothetical protein
MACIDGEDRFGAREPRDRLEPRKPSAASAAPEGRISGAPSCPRLYRARLA